jgi:hypothetical protein
LIHLLESNRRFRAAVTVRKAGVDRQVPIKETTVSPINIKYVEWSRTHPNCVDSPENLVIRELFTIKIVTEDYSSLVIGVWDYLDSDLAKKDVGYLSAED